MIAFIAVPVAAFFAEPRLAYILWALSSGTVIAGLASIGVADFRRDLKFEREFLLQIPPHLCSIMITIAFAWTWHSSWALISGILAGRVLRTLFSYRMHNWRPRLTQSEWRLFLGFSLWGWAVSMAQLIRDWMDAFVLGRILNPAAVGIYAIGEEIAALPTSELVLPLCRACFSGFAAARTAGHGTSDAFMRPVAVTFLVTLPAGLGISLVADPLVRLVVGGLLRRQFSITSVCVVVRLILLIPLITRFGIPGAAIGTLSGMLLEHLLLLIVVFRRFQFSTGKFIGRIWRTIVAAAAMAMVLVVTDFGWTQTAGDAISLARTLLLAVSLGAGVYLLTLSALWVLSGRPLGAESDMLSVLVRTARNVTGRPRSLSS